MLETASRQIADYVNQNLGPIAGWLEHWVWSYPEQVPLLAAVLVATGLFVTVRLAFVQIRGFRHAIDVTLGKYDNPEDEGDLKHFQALTTALSATVGIGNIAGVAIALRLGGPGALFWMWLTAFFGMALKFVECTLAIMHRRVHPDGSVSGGPMHYIELGLGGGFKWMAVLFAGFAAVASFGGGCMNQSNTLADQVRSNFGIPTIVTGLVFSAIVATVIIGGIRRIGRVTSILAPSMAALYVAGALIVLLMNIGEIPGAFRTVVTQAFAPEPLVGGGVGSLLITAMWGIRRGLFSNEAGQGSAPIAHAAAKTKEPVREGLVASLGPFIDTLVICTMTGLSILVSGAYTDKDEQRLSLAEVEAVAGTAEDTNLLERRRARVQAGERALAVRGGRLEAGTLFVFDSTVVDPIFLDESDAPWDGTLRLATDGALAFDGEGPSPIVRGKALLTGAPLTARAFGNALGGAGNLIVTLAVILFAVSTGISWSYYGDRSVEYLFGPGAIPIYRWVFILFFFTGSILPLSAVWTFGDVALGLMTFPNLIAVLLLSGGVARATTEYFSREHKAYK